MTVSYIGGKMIFCDGSRFWGRQFQLLKNLRAAALVAFKAGIVQPQPPRVAYFGLNRKHFRPQRGVDLATEIDLRAAYPTAALRLNILDAELFKKLKAEPKQHRTKLLGALAVRRHITRFDTLGRKIDQRTEFDPVGVATWRTICAKVGNDLADVARRDKGYLCFWVDNYWTTDTEHDRHGLEKIYDLESETGEISWERIGREFVVFKATRDRAFTFPFHIGIHRPK
jgi:hypothetical protein